MQITPAIADIAMSSEDVAVWSGADMTAVNVDDAMSVD